MLGSLAWEGLTTDNLSGNVENSPAVNDIQWHILTPAERNPPPLFGLGRIDELSEWDLEKNASHEPPSVRGRVHEIKRGVVAKFGWKAQIATLDEFVHVACAGELGLEVPGHHQAITPDGLVHTGGLDMNEDECKAIATYIASLPSPTRAPGSEADVNVQAGERLFQRVGCTNCHSASVGAVSGLYSDLLLHDLGARWAARERTTGRPRSASGTPVPPGPASGGRSLSGATATPPRISTTAEPGTSTRPSSSIVGRATIPGRRI